MNTNNNSQINKHSLVFGLISVFLIGISFSIVMPVIPFLVAPYVSSASSQALIVTLLTSIYAVCTFFSGPILGAMSDRYGRRPILLISLLGASLGFFIFGLGGALWVLFLGRIIEGITGGSIGTIFAYFADITPTEERTKYFGWVSAIVGVGTILGPTLGGLISAQFGNSAPMFFGSLLALLNALYGYFYMPESLKSENRSGQISISQFNPLSQLKYIFSISTIQRLLLAATLLWISSASIQAVFSQFSIDTFNWNPALIGLMFSIMGLQDIISQSLIMPQMLKFMSDKQIASTGIVAEVIGYTLMAISIITAIPVILVVGVFIYGFGDSVFGPSFNGLLSKSVGASEQGRVQGGVQSIQSLTRIFGPLIAGQIYILLGHSAPAIMGAVLLFIAFIVIILRRGK
ncbi:tetracycline resistance MFS efflux pump [Floricoccus tropicus]|uniref:Tetracycline resistance MFS efflux pump n=1 Tax=Floricoccus tropicus TaxID=1859473 RepID=A0A1E8GKM6_9LACT|nr:MFS transporter [Floricoccus tropicus]OFI48223.1 tetracycline resistance MFS efflux pump [Floricoccus tropicus]